MTYTDINALAYGPHPYSTAITHLMHKLSSKGIAGNEKEEKKDIYKTIKNAISGEGLPFTILQHACDETGLLSSIDEQFNKMLRNRR